MVKVRYIGTIMLGLTTVLVAAGCDDNPLSEGRSDTVRFQNSHSFLIVDAADSVDVEALPVNNFAEPTGITPTATACDGGIEVIEDPDQSEFEDPGHFVVIGQQLGPTCFEVSAGGVVDTIDVSVVPAEMEAEIGTVGSGQTATVDVTYFDAEGDAITGFEASDLVFESDDAGVGEVDESGTVTAKSPGSTTLSVALNEELHGALRSTEADLEVVPGEFTGDLSSETVEQFDTVVVTAAEDQPFDDDTDIMVNEHSPWILSIDETEAEFIMPAVAEGEEESEIVVVNIGPDQIGLAAPITVSNAGAPDPFEPGDDLATASELTMPAEVIGAVDPDNLDDFYRLELDAETVVEFGLDWSDADADVDVLIYNSAGEFNGDFGCASPNIPEACSMELEAGTWYIDINAYDAADVQSIYRLTVSEG